jgi:hypothetical protein
MGSIASWFFGDGERIIVACHSMQRVKISFNNFLKF